MSPTLDKGVAPSAIERVSSFKTPGTPSEKGVTISDEPEQIEAPTCYFDDQLNSALSSSPKQHRTSISSKRMTGRSDRPPLSQVASASVLTPQLSNVRAESPELSTKPSREDGDGQVLYDQVLQWLQDEKARRAEGRPVKSKPDADQSTSVQDLVDSREHQSLEKLEQILARFSASTSLSAAQSQRQAPTATTGGRVHGRRASLARALLKSKQKSSHGSETDAGDAVATVPHVEASLDNSKTLAYSGGAADTRTDAADKTKDQQNWDTFKGDILRLTHTLGLRGWRRLDPEYGPAIQVERLSGALTNAVYVVKPPKNYTLLQKKDENGNIIPVKKQPKELLLRIYGPQVGHLIDRESELLILRRLAAKNIGPKLLGYFDNGRFEEFLHAKTLQPQDLRDPETSKQIAKRMKELHEGIDLLESERRGGPFVFANWDKWVDRVEQIITWLDKQVHDEAKGKAPASQRYTRRGLICGVEWKVFRKAYEKYRAKLIEECGGNAGMSDQLVFAHNDTQYGNLMRLKPADESPLLQPTNSHKQLVVIDFEYANANTPGLEFANHFTEWCYNYHDPEKPWACTTNRYPTPEEQYRFVRAYVMHRSQFAPSASSTPNLEGKEKTGIPPFRLDPRAPSTGPGHDYDAEEQTREKAQEQEIQRLLQSTRLWRIANSAQWTAWGIVQAKVPELEKPRKRSIAAAVVEKVKQKIYARSDPLDDDVKEIQEDSKHDRPEGREQEAARREGDGTDEEEDEDEDSFDYLAYAQERAMFFWGDCILRGIVEENDLPEEMRPHIKYVKY